MKLTKFPCTRQDHVDPLTAKPLPDPLHQSDELSTGNLYNAGVAPFKAGVGHNLS